MVDDETWQIRYLIISTTNWWPGKTVLIAPEWANRVNWPEGKIHLEMTREAIKSSPQWNSTYPIELAYEEQVYRHYARIKDWPGRDGNVPGSVDRQAQTPEEL